MPRCAEWDEDEDEPEDWEYTDLRCLVPPASIFSGALSLPCADPADKSKTPTASAAEDSAVSTGGSDSHEDGAGKPGSDSAGSHGNELVEGDEYEDFLKEDPDAWPHRPGQYYHAACIMSSHRQLGIASLAMAQELILETRCTIPQLRMVQLANSTANVILKAASHCCSKETITKVSYIDLTFVQEKVIEFHFVASSRAVVRAM